MVEWVAKSGLSTRRHPTNNDKPECESGIPQLDNYSSQRLLATIAGLIPRNYVVMEVKQNLIESDRKDSLSKFIGPNFRKVAHVVVGSPSDEFKAEVKKRLLNNKQDKIAEEW